MPNLTDAQVTRLCEVFTEGAQAACHEIKPGELFSGAYGSADSHGFVGGTPFDHKLRDCFVQGYIASCPNSVRVDVHGRVIAD